MKKVVNYIECVVNASYFAHMFSSNRLKINRIIGLLPFILVSYMSHSQAIKTGQVAWQQEVNYRIDVELNDIDHKLSGTESLVYVNNSPDELTYIMMHLWPNAYKNNYTAFGQQMLGNGSTKFYFAKEEDRGWIDGLDFTVNGEKVQWALDKDHIDIARLELNEPLKPGARITIETPFKVKIPGSFSRFGHKKNGYQITQWYPKPAVYDANGWNAMPYLDQGEFYSEFGSFDVKITLPKDYVVSATGVLQEAEEWAFMAQREAKPLSVEDQDRLKGDTSVPTYKTLTFRQDRIHDFAWFADKTFNITTKHVVLNSGDSVQLMVFTNEEYKAKLCDTYADYLGNAITYYSEHIGDYPYRYCSIVQGALVSGGGMEYPMVTVIPYFTEEVIVHEVGHNWFYGILGSNERRYPWMDESINSYYENRTIYQNSKDTLPERDPLGAMKVKETMRDPGSSVMRLLATDMERRWKHQPIAAPSEIYNMLNYATIVYGKGIEAFDYLEAYLGRETIDKGFQLYFNEWKFRHPLPDDLKKAMEKASGKDLSWFFDQYLVSDGIIDYSVISLSKESGKLVLSNEGDLAVPFPVDYILGDKIVKSIWVEGFTGEKVFELPQIEFDAIKIDARRILTETYTRNNTYRLNAVSPRIEKFRRAQFFTLEDPNRTQLTLNAIGGWNAFDKFMVGAIVSNFRIPRQKFEFITTPMYGLGTNELVGYGDLRYTTYYRNSRLNYSQIGANISRFSHDPAGIYTDRYTYSRYAPFVKWSFARPSFRSRISRTLTLRTTWITFKPFRSDDEKLQEIELSDSSRRSSFVSPNTRTFIELGYEYANRRALNPYGIRLNVQTGMVSNTTTWLDSSRTTDDEVFTKVEVTGKYTVSYPFHDKGLDIRVYIGSFITGADATAFQFPVTNSNNDNVQPDYTYAYAQMGRGVQNGIFTNQIIDGGAFLKNIGMLNTADKWIGAVNFESGLPVDFPVGLYMDLFSTNNIEMISGDKDIRFGYSGGVSIEIIPKIIKVYVPLFASPFITDAQEFQGVNKFTEKISFTINLSLLNPFLLRESIQLDM